MKLYEEMLKKVIRNKQTSAPDEVIAEHLSSILVTVNAINDVERENDFVEGTAHKVTEYELPECFLPLIVPLSLGFFGGRKYFDFIDHDFHRIDDVPEIGRNELKINENQDKTLSKTFTTKVLTPAALKESFMYLYGVLRGKIKDDGFKPVSRKNDTVKVDDVDKYGWVTVQSTGDAKSYDLYMNSNQVLWPIVLSQSVMNPNLVNGVLINRSEYFGELISELIVSMRS